MTVSGMGQENMAARRWGIKIQDWWNMPRLLRIAHLAEVVAEDIRTLLFQKED